MSFYRMMRDRFPKLNEAAVARKLEVEVTTLRGWRISQPKAQFIKHVAAQLNMRPGDLFEEFLADYDSEQRQHEQKCSNG